MKAWAMVPARGGSKSIPQKNLVSVNGHPLIEYGIRAALSAGCFERILCSTDDDRIAETVAGLGIEIDRRPDELAGDDTAVADVCREFLDRSRKHQEIAPDWLFLIQPTSPFLLPEHITDLLAITGGETEAVSAQTVTPVPHNHHAWNQRQVESGRASFVFAEERKVAYNKQRKPKYFVFGNVVAARPQSLLAGGDFFSEPSVASEIPSPYDFDLDGPEDLLLAAAMLTSGLISLPHMDQAQS